MDYQDLRLTIADGVAELTLDRPGDRNAFSGPMAASLARAYRECDARDDVRAVILTGAGSAFCVGAAGCALRSLQRFRSHSTSASNAMLGAARKPVCFVANAKPVAIPTTSNRPVVGCLT